MMLTHLSYYTFLFLISCPSNIISSFPSSKSYHVRREQKEIVTTSTTTTTKRKTQNIMNNDCYKSIHYPLYDNMMHLKGSGQNEKYDLTLHYSLSESQDKNKNRELFTAHMEYRGLGYVSWGISSDGMMVPGDAIIGLPDEPNSQTNPGKYIMSSKALSGVALYNNNKQNLINSIVTQDDTFTNLTFTKLLVEDDDSNEEYDILSTGPNYFMWAVGIINGLSMHRSRETFVLDFSTSCIGADDEDEEMNVFNEENEEQQIVIADEVIDEETVVVEEQSTSLPETDTSSATTEEESVVTEEEAVEMEIEKGSSEVIEQIAVAEKEAEEETIAAVKEESATEEQTVTTEEEQTVTPEEEQSALVEETPEEEEEDLIAAMDEEDTTSTGTEEEQISIVQDEIEETDLVEESVVSTEESTIEEEIKETEEVMKNGAECNGNSDNPNYTHMVSLEKDKSIIFYYKLNINNNAGESESDSKSSSSLSAQMLYKGKGYVSWAIAPTGMMVYSESVIGLPDQPLSASNPGKYALTSLENDGVVLMPAQTLLNSNITQNETTTILSFTKLLDEDGELPINPNGINTFTWAVGTGNELGYHIKRSSFQLDLSKTCSDKPSDFVISLSGSKRPVSLSYWKAHGILAGISWAIFVPFAIMSSWYRDLLNGPIWMKLHIYLNVLCCFFTTLSFIIAVVAIAKSGGQHFITPHQKLGLAMFILVILQTINGYRRPPKGGSSKQTYVRRGWEYIHKLLGYILFIASVWEVQEGLRLYEIRSGKDFRQFFWGWVFALTFVNAIVSFYIYIYLGVVCEEPVPIETFTDVLPVVFPRFTPEVRYSEKGNITVLPQKKSKSSSDACPKKLKAKDKKEPVSLQTFTDVLLPMLPVSFRKSRTKNNT